MTTRHIIQAGALVLALSAFTALANPVSITNSEYLTPSGSGVGPVLVIHLGNGPYSTAFTTDAPVPKRVSTNDGGDLVIKARPDVSPDGGATLGLLGISLIAIGGWRKWLAR